MRSTVMVRVGGGWMALDEFLVKNDPCRGKRFHFFMLRQIVQMRINPSLAINFFDNFRLKFC